VPGVTVGYQHGRLPHRTSCSAAAVRRMYRRIGLDPSDEAAVARD
jgi:hypothetical protein